MDSSSSPNLFCNENDSFLYDNIFDDDKKDDSVVHQFTVSESDCEFIEMLIRREPFYGTNRLKTDRASFHIARSESVKWILETRALFGYHYRTAYLALVYLDRYFTRVTIADDKVWAIRLLAVACLSLAAKLEESVPRLLPDYHVDGYNFQGAAVQKMELMVLRTLEWKMNYATPFAYLEYFAVKFCAESKHDELINRANELIMAVIQEVNVVETRPSIVAGAAILAAYDHELAKDELAVKMDLIPLWRIVDKEHMFSCYSVFQNNLRSRSMPSKSITGVKRSLTFDSSDQYCPIRKR